MKIIDQLKMLNVPVTDMVKAKEFYINKLGLKITNDYRQDDSHWWISLEFPDGGASIVLTTFHEKNKPGDMKLYLSTTDIETSFNELKSRGVKPVNEITKDPWGTWFEIKDSDGNRYLIMQS